VFAISKFSSEAFFISISFIFDKMALHFVSIFSKRDGSSKAVIHNSRGCKSIQRNWLFSIPSSVKSWTWIPFENPLDTGVICAKLYIRDRHKATEACLQTFAQLLFESLGFLKRFRIFSLIVSRVSSFPFISNNAIWSCRYLQLFEDLN